MASEKITSVLIVDDVAEARENVRKLLQFDANVEVVGASSNGLEAIDLAIETQPDVVLMDINMPEMDGITATENIRKKVPHAQIIILSVQGDTSYMRRAMLAGARDFLTKPVDVDELSAAIRTAGEVARNEREKLAGTHFAGGSTSLGPAGTLLPGDQGRIVTVFSPKGGSGKTTIASNLAIALQKSGKAVVAVDGNLQFGDLSFSLNQQGRNNITDLAASVNELDREVLSEVMIEHEKSGVQILAAPMRPEHADSISGEQFGQILNYLRGMFPIVLVDSSSLLTDITLAALDASDIIILTTTQDIPAVKNTRLFLDVADALGIIDEQLLLVLNRYDKRRNITPERIQKNFDRKFSTIIPLDEKLIIPSMDRGEPFVSSDEDEPASKAILNLMEDLLKALKERQSAEVEMA
jgi:pilus assembly protein CpaE